jgi:tRNA pseudouridine38-40 synthase
MKRYFVKLAFRGTAFHGWQIQKNAITVQQLLNNAFSLLLRENIKLTGCGRTDAGVHAWQFFAHFESEKVLDEKEREQLVFKLNNYLPQDVVIHSVFPVEDHVNARFTATSRTYQYVLTRNKDPFMEGFSHYVYGPIHVEAMNQAALLLTGKHDFTSFSRVDTQTRTNLCTVSHAFWKERDNLLVFTICADRFLRNMVRAVVGTLLDVGVGKMDAGDVEKILASKNRSNAGDSVPACGLFLIEVTYPFPIL